MQKLTITAEAALMEVEEFAISHGWEALVEKVHEVKSQVDFSPMDAGYRITGLKNIKRKFLDWR